MVSYVDNERTERREDLSSDMSRTGFGADGEVASVYTLATYFLDLVEQDFSPSILDFLPCYCVERLRDRMHILSKIEAKVRAPYNPAIEERVPMFHLGGNESQGLRQRRAYPSPMVHPPPIGENQQGRSQSGGIDDLVRYVSPLEYVEAVNERNMLQLVSVPGGTSLDVNKIKERLARAASEKTCVLLMTLLHCITAAAMGSLAAFQRRSPDSASSSGFYFAGKAIHSGGA